MVLKDGTALTSSGAGPVGRNGPDLSDLLGGDTRRGTWTFQLGPLDQVDHLAIANDADEPSVAWTVDLTHVSEEQSKITATHDYPPKSSPPMGTLQQVTRLDGASLDVTPTQLRNLQASLPGYTSVCVELHITVTGTEPAAKCVRNFDVSAVYEIASWNALLRCFRIARVSSGRTDADRS
jgi:hypothetical protein